MYCMIKKNNGTTTDDVEFVALRFRLVKQPWDHFAPFRNATSLLTLSRQV